MRYIWFVAILVLGAFEISSMPSWAQSSTVKVDVETIARVCSGTTTATAPNARGSYTDSNGYTFEFGGSGSEPITVSRGGVLLYKIEKYTADDYLNCMKEMVVVLSQPPIPEQISCRIPENGIERYQSESDISMTSPERSGGGSQPEWCTTAISLLRAQNPDGEFSVVSSSESTRSGCSPFNCTLYTYQCTIHVKANPLYNYKQSPQCPR